uniref:tRNA-synt_2c domain-containing protein n=1 Tax=Bursaphelenchus xylophilus TaxID=6326 RepID=A0A1I7SRH1_BURXY
MSNVISVKKTVFQRTSLCCDLIERRMSGYIGSGPSSKSLADELDFAVDEVRPFVSEFEKSTKLEQGPELFYANLITKEGK